MDDHSFESDAWGAEPVTDAVMADEWRQYGLTVADLVASRIALEAHYKGAAHLPNPAAEAINSAIESMDAMIVSRWSQTRKDLVGKVKLLLQLMSDEDSYYPFEDELFAHIEEDRTRFLRKQFGGMTREEFANSPSGLAGDTAGPGAPN